MKKTVTQDSVACLATSDWTRKRVRSGGGVHVTGMIGEAGMIEVHLQEIEERGKTPGGEEGVSIIIVLLLYQSSNSVSKKNKQAEVLWSFIN